MSEVIVLGGGISGLASAYYLAKKGYRVTILEKNKEIGGLGSSYYRPKYTIEKTYHAIFAGDTHTIELLGELKILHKVKWFSTGISYFYNKKIYNFSSPLDIIKNKALSFFDKAVLGRIYLELKIIRNWEKLDAISVKEWIISKGSKNLYSFLFEPLLNIKWGEQRDFISAAWLWGRINPRATSRNYTGGNERMGYPIGGYQIILNSLKEAIEKNNGKIYNNTEVKKIDFEDGSVKSIIYTKEGEDKEISFDFIVSTIPTPVFVELSTNLPRRLKQLRNIEYEGLICATIGLKNKTIEAYQMPCAPGTTFFGGIVEHTNCVPPEYCGGEHIIYLFNYVKEDSKIWNLSNEEILKSYVEDLKKINPKFDKEDIIWCEIYRNRHATPIYKTNYLKYMPPLQFNNLYFAGMFNTYPISDFNNSIRVGKEIALKLGESHNL